jgi:hypothetical protein
MKPDILTYYRHACVPCVCAHSEHLGGVAQTSCLRVCQPSVDTIVDAARKVRAPHTHPGIDISAMLVVI